MKLHHIALSVKDSAVSAKFYKENLGFKELNRFTKPKWNGSAVISELGNIQLELFEFGDSKKGQDDSSDLHIRGLKHIGIEVDSVEEKHKELKEKGIDIDNPKKGTTCKMYCFFRDPDGGSLELYESL